MKSILSGRFPRLGLLFGAMVTVYLVGWEQRIASANASKAKFEVFLRNAKDYKRLHPIDPKAAIAQTKQFHPFPANPGPNDGIVSYKFGDVTLSLKRLSNMDDSPIEYYIDGVEIGFLIQLNAKAALALLATLPDSKQTEAAYEYAFNQWILMNSDDPEIVAAANALPPGPERTAALKGAIAVLAEKDPQAALDYAVGLPPEESALLIKTISAASRSDPELAAQYLDKITDATARNNAIRTIAENWGIGSDDSTRADDPAAALKWLDQVATGATYDSAVKSIFSDLAEHNPGAGATLLGQLTDQADRNAVITQLASKFAADDPAVAADWAEALPATDGAARSNALNAILSKWVKSDPTAALAFAQNLNDPALSLAAAPALAGAMAQTDPNAAMAWVNNLPEGATKDQAINTVLVKVAQSDFTSAWNDASNLPPGAGHDAALDSLVGTLAAKNPAEAANLLGQYNAGAPSDSTINLVAARWATQDVTAASVWINTLPAGAKRDGATVQLANAQTTTNPAGALSSATGIGNQATRVAVIQKVIQAWASQNLPAALAAAQTADLPPARRAALIQAISQKATK